MLLVALSRRWPLAVVQVSRREQFCWCLPWLSPRTPGEHHEEQQHLKLDSKSELAPRPSRLCLLLLQPSLLLQACLGLFQDRVATAIFLYQSVCPRGIPTSLWIYPHAQVDQICPIRIMKRRWIRRRRRRRAAQSGPKSIGACQPSLL